MGQFLKRLFFFALNFFQTIGEATIWILRRLYRLIVLTISALSRLLLLLLVLIGSLAIGLYSLGTTIVTVIKNNIRVLLFGMLSLFGTIRFPRIRLPKLSLTLPTIHLNRKTRKKAKIKRSFFRKIVWFSLGFSLACILVIIPVGYYIIIQDLPNPHMLTQRAIPMTTKIYDRNGTLLYEIYADQNRTPVPLAEIPQHFKNATIAIEDKSFYQHQGFSIEGITRAAYATFMKNDIQGGSTITQQLVRSALLNRELTLERKVKELIVSVWSEHIYTKDQILEMYFNQVPYGGTAWGAEAAAQAYLGKSIRDVSLPEAALLAGLPAAPTTYSPFGAHPELAVIRQKQVLNRMEEEGYITRQEREVAQAEEIQFATQNIGIKAPHFVMFIRDLLATRYGMRAVEQGGLRVMTSLDMDLQNKIQALVKTEVEKLKDLNVGNGAAVVTNPQTGEIYALVGSIDYFDVEHDGNVNVTLTPQQPGSTIKVVTYAAALQNGLTAATLLDDSPITYTVPGSSPYSPVNYDGRFHGLIPMRYALGNSYNIPAVRALARIGIPTMVSQGKKMGISSWDDSYYYGLSVTLGGTEVTMLDMASVYGTLAAEGKHHALTPILTVTDYLGNTLEDNRNSDGEEALSSDVAFIISDILSDNNARIASFGPSSMLTIPNQWVAVKTGTSNEKRDNWAIGYTKDFVVTAWVGNNDNTPMNQVLTSGITGATPIWRAITDMLLEKYPSPEAPTPPDTIVKASCRGREEYFIRGTEKNACFPIPTPKPTESPDSNSHPV